MTLETTPTIFSICRLDPDQPIPAWATQSSLYSISRSQDELSIVCPQSDVPSGVKCEKDWRSLKVKGPLDFALTGILASLASPLAKARISIFAISTFDTDYILVKQSDLEQAVATLTQAGHSVTD